VELYLEKTKYSDPSAEDHSYDDEFIFVSNHLAAFSVMETKSERDRLLAKYHSVISDVMPSWHSLYRDDKQTIFRVVGIVGPPYEVDVMDDVLTDQVQNGFQSANLSSSSSSLTPSGSASHVVFKDSGSGLHTTEKFTVAGEWDLSWYYDCSGYGSEGNFAILGYVDGENTPNVLVNQIGMSDKSVEHLHEGGRMYLQINSECSWQISVWQLP